MRAAAVLLLVAALIAAPGCKSMYDVLFGCFSWAYSDGGYDEGAKRQHFQASMERWDAHQPE